MTTATAHPDHLLISSEDVEGTHVYDINGEKIGEIDHLMIAKFSGRVTYAVMSFGGFLGLGHSHYPLPWDTLKYNPKLAGYETNVTEAHAQGRARVQRRFVDRSQLGDEDPLALQRASLLVSSIPLNNPCGPAASPAAGELDMYRRRGRSVGTFIIGAIVLLAVIYAVFAARRLVDDANAHI